MIGWRGWRAYGATGEPGTCEWCGNVLRQPIDSAQKVEIANNHIAVSSIPKAERKFRYDKPGGYGDGHFCGLRCGYMFGVEIANQGTRLHPVRRQS